MLINFFVMATLFTSKYSVKKAVSWLICPLLRVRVGVFLYFLHHSEDSTSPEQIEGHLPEKAIDAVLGKLGKPCSESLAVQMA